jgi:DNA-binding NtrC family response regulator
MNSLTRLSRYLASHNPNLVVISGEVCRPDSDKLIRLLRRLETSHPRTQILLIVDEDQTDLAARAMEAGAFLYAKRPLSDTELKRLMAATLERQPQFVDERQLLKRKHPERMGPIVGRAPVMQRLFEQIARAAASEVPLLLLGETGSGKDLVAQTIHQLSSRKRHPYIPVNLGSLPIELVASELFGHEKGAFTGAAGVRRGVFEQADQGTVFLDEIDAVNEKVQVSLLRLLERNEFRRLGGKEAIHTDARIIAASNADLDELVKNKRFRDDLFFRLDVVRIMMPPLRERPDDIPLLVNDYLAHYNDAYGGVISGISTTALKALQAYNWPGNVRELRNVVQRAALVRGSGEIDVEHLPKRFGQAATSDISMTFPLGTSLKEVEREMILRALEATENNRTRAAELLGISRRVLYNKLKSHGIK